MRAFPAALNNFSPKNEQSVFSIRLRYEAAISAEEEMKMKPSFSNILEKAARKNRNALMQKAFVANRMAKVARGASRIGSYAVKSKALNAIIDKFPNEVEIGYDPTFPEMVVVSVLKTKFGLHAPRIALKASES